MIDLTELYPEHLLNDTVREILKVINSQIADEELAVDELIREFNISTATISLPIWSKWVGVEYKENLPLDVMRGNILSGLETNKTTTVSIIKEIAEKYSNGTCDIIENYSDYSFIVKFTSSAGVPTKIDEIKKSIDRVKPAHLSYSFEFIFRAWADIKAMGLTWGQQLALGRTFKELRERSDI